ncbi:MAG: hypothetical protein ABWZ76_00575 [Acidimicrobiales bacterium]
MAPEPWPQVRQRNEARCERILNLASPLVVHDLAWNDVATVPIDDAVLDALVYMRDVEGFTDS